MLVTIARYLPVHVSAIRPPMGQNSNGSVTAVANELLNI